MGAASEPFLLILCTPCCPPLLVPLFPVLPFSPTKGCSRISPRPADFRSPPRSSLATSERLLCTFLSASSVPLSFCATILANTAPPSPPSPPAGTDFALAKLTATAYWTYEWAPFVQSAWPLLSRWYSPFSTFRSRRQSSASALDPAWAEDDGKLPDVVVLSLGYHVAALSVEEFASRAKTVFSLFADLPAPPKLIYVLNIFPDPSLIPEKYSSDVKHRTKLHAYHKNLAILNLVSTTFPEITVVDFMSMELPLGKKAHSDAVHLSKLTSGRYGNDAFRDAVVREVCKQFDGS